jgi:cellulose synthase/poly-beta-1,6-N-acetylglucosamine synthase-like glycosyltransferase
MIEIALLVVFWVATALVIYVYAGYPLLLYLLARCFPQRELAGDTTLRPVSLIISAYNERAVMTEKLENSLALDYPRELMDIIVVSDCSTDGTDDVVQKYRERGVRLVRQSARLGKSEGLNLGVPEASGEILVFSDANAIYSGDAVRRLVSHFADPQVGYVVGNARYVENINVTPSAQCEGIYWKFETWLKQCESRFGSVVGGDGAIYAIRRQLFSPLRPTDINDLLNPLQIIVRGYRGVYEPAAICTEEAGDSFEKEFRRKVRIVGRSLNAVWRAPAVLWPWTQPRHWFALISHKLLRWFVPFFLLFCLMASLCLWKLPFYRIAAVLQLGFFALASAGWLVRHNRSLTNTIYFPYYFCLVNLASMLGIMKFFGGSLSPTWQTIRQESPEKRDSDIHAMR